MIFPLRFKNYFFQKLKMRNYGFILVESDFFTQPTRISKKNSIIVSKSIVHSRRNDATNDYHLLSRSFIGQLSANFANDAKKSCAERRRRRRRKNATWMQLNRSKNRIVIGDRRCQREPRRLKSVRRSRYASEERYTVEWKQARNDARVHSCNLINDCVDQLWTFIRF